MWHWQRQALSQDIPLKLVIAEMEADGVEVGNASL